MYFFSSNIILINVFVPSQTHYSKCPPAQQQGIVSDIASVYSFSLLLYSEK